jgi:hypothetical protein
VIVLEGAETHERSAALGMHATAQGYCTGRPAPADRLWGLGLDDN